MKSKLIIIGFIFMLLILATLGIVKGNATEEKVNHAIGKSLDSLISKKIIDYRYTSYDNRFLYENLVVVDSSEKIIGIPILYLNDSVLQSFYNSNADFRKTRFYENIKNRKIKILVKK